MGKMLRVFKDFRGGLSEMANDNMPDNSLVLAKNTVPGDYAGLSKVSGTSFAFADNPQIDDIGPVMWLLEFQPTSGNGMMIAFTKASDSTMHMYKRVVGSSQWTQILFANDETSTANVLDYFIYAGKLYWLNGTNIMIYDGGNNAPAEAEEDYGKDPASGLWSIVKTAVAVEQRGHRWFYGTRDNQVIFSGTYNPLRFSPTSVIDVSGGASIDDHINALHEFNDGILIFLTRSVYYLSGWDFAEGTDVKMTRLNVTTGTKWPKTVKTIENAVLYLGVDGLYQLSLPYYFTQIVTKNLSEKKVSKRLTREKPLDCYGEVFGGIYHLSLRYANNIKEYRYYISEKSWWGEFTQEPWCYYRGGEYLYIGCNNGYVLKYDSESHKYIRTSDGSKMPIEFTAETKGYDVAGAMFRDSKLKRAFVAVKQYVEESTTLKLQIKADYKDAAWDWTVNEVDFDESLVWKEGNYDFTYWGWLDTVTKEIAINKKAKRIQYLFYEKDADDDQVGQPVTIYGVGVLYKRKKVKGNRDGVSVADIMYDV